MPDNNISAEFGKIENVKENTKELNEYDTTNSTDEFDWDFILEREWSRTKK